MSFINMDDTTVVPKARLEELVKYEKQIRQIKSILNTMPRSIDDHWDYPNWKGLETEIRDILFPKPKFEFPTEVGVKFKAYSKPNKIPITLETYIGKQGVVYMSFSTGLMHSAEGLKENYTDFELIDE